ncbi:hypothetical protein CAPTEDRAFT_191966 [Capitella teleta]|uniref:ZSWIM1/3 RNaseH-like domain-containing protein n=1 Tax=Capitella teleta TaxID=283909 RepID=R7U632_CAPTE|nr:hypothetical protein CAPTEDRAFT_191966 [Capitella teleta]|eukprot:ELU01825.1 hypothetical protein CAPTEDRAFT_191966 [Capitella teleta]
MNEMELLLKEVETVLSDNPRTHVKFEMDDNTNELGMLYFQTFEMFDLYQKFPEALLIDATYCVNKKQMPLYCLMCQDGDGHGRIVAYAIVWNESYLRIQSILTTFKEKNYCGNLRSMVMDKDLTEIKVVKEVFPDLPVIICKFHVLKAFKKETSRISCMQTREEACSLLQKIVLASSSDVYDQLYADLRTTLRSSPEFLAYYDRKLARCA